jgi:alpha-1,3-mannosyl-glycoprotein beta-1,2-N-acetylglucosaminyltransferase
MVRLTNTTVVLVFGMLLLSWVGMLSMMAIPTDGAPSTATTGAKVSLSTGKMPKNEDVPSAGAADDAAAGTAGGHKERMMENKIAALQIEVQSLARQLSLATARSSDKATPLDDGASPAGDDVHQRLLALRTAALTEAEASLKESENKLATCEGLRLKLEKTINSDTVERNKKVMPVKGSSMRGTVMKKPTTIAAVTETPGDDTAIETVDDDGPITPVIIFTYSRAAELKRCIDRVLAVMPKKGFRLYVSQDGTDTPDIGRVIEVARKAHRATVKHLIHVRDDSGATDQEKDSGWQPYYAISHHYGWAINQVFKADKRFDRVILLEDDIDISNDFFAYMTATGALMAKDPTIYCVSGFNDNGKKELVADTKQLYRSDFFPGLGWMMSRAVWDELAPIWPKGFWDDWMRQPDKRKSRSCIRPEVPRTFTRCSEEGVSQGQFCAEHLESIKLADTVVDWASLDLSYLVEPEYRKHFDTMLSKAKEVQSPGELETMPAKFHGGDVKIVYRDNSQFVAFARQLNLMSDFKDGVPRTAYRGAVTFRWHKHTRVHLVAYQPLYAYD